MSRRKHLEEQMLSAPELQEGQAIARVVKLHGSNIVEVETPKVTEKGLSSDEDDLQECLCLLPAKFSKRFWVKRGNFVVIEFTVAKDHSTGGKIKGTITHILYPDHVKELKKDRSLWPEVFRDDVVKSGETFDCRGEGYDDDGGGGDDSDDSDDLPPLPPNPNRPKGYMPRQDTDSSSSDSESG